MLIQALSTILIEPLLSRFWWKRLKMGNHHTSCMVATAPPRTVPWEGSSPNEAEATECGSPIRRLRDSVASSDHT
jgi:hypothetical protein